MVVLARLAARLERVDVRVSWRLEVSLFSIIPVLFNRWGTGVAELVKVLIEQRDL